MLLPRFQERLSDPSLRPAGSVPVEMLVFTFPIKPPDTEGEGAAPADSAARADTAAPADGEPPSGGAGLMTRSLAPLRHRGFRRLVGGQLASNFGDAFYAVALPWYVLAEHGGALLLGTVLAAYGVPRTVLLAAGGQASDRWRPWMVMMTSDSVRAVAVAALAVAAASGPAQAVVLVPIAAVLGAGEGLFLPGSFAIVPVLLPDEELQSGNALASAVTQLATLAGPAVGGALVALAGPAPAFAVDAATFVVSALTLSGVRSAQRSATVTGARPRAPRSPLPGQKKARFGPRLTRRRRRYCSQRKPADRVEAAALRTDPADLAAGHRRGQPGLGRGRRGSPALAGAWAVAWQRGQLRQPYRRLRCRRSARYPRRRPGPPCAAARSAGLPRVPGRGSLPRRGPLRRRPDHHRCRHGRRWRMQRLRQRRDDHGFPAVGAAEPAGQAHRPADLCSFGVFPISVALGALVVHNYGPALFFPLAAAVLAAAILAGLSQRSWREFGAADPSAAASPQRLPHGRRPGVASATTDIAESTS